MEEAEEALSITWLNVNRTIPNSKWVDRDRLYMKVSKMNLSIYSYTGGHEPTKWESYRWTK